MELCISNIAWAPNADDRAYSLLAENRVKLIELAPTRWWPDLASVSDREVDQCRLKLAAHELQPVAFQAVLFGRPDLAVFGPDGGRACGVYLEAVIDLAARLGTSTIVFGSPKNRLRGPLSRAQAMVAATSFFRRIGDVAAARDVRFCFEPNPASYGADFGCSFSEGVELVDAVDSPGFWINVDAGALTLNDEDAAASIALASSKVGHFHMSEPFLAGYQSPRGDHSAIAEALRIAGYDGVISIEMKPQPTGWSVIEDAFEFARHHYPC